MDDRWQSVQEIADHLGVSTDSVYRWVEQRCLPVHRIGRLLRFRCSEVDEWVMSQSTGPATSNGSSRKMKLQKPRSGKRAAAHR